MIRVKCKRCGVEFEAKRTTAKFCSDHCRATFARVGAVKDENEGRPVEGPKKRGRKKGWRKASVLPVRNAQVLANKQVKETLEGFQKEIEQAVADEKFKNEWLFNEITGQEHGGQENSGTENQTIIYESGRARTPAEVEKILPRSTMPKDLAGRIKWQEKYDALLLGERVEVYL